MPFRQRPVVCSRKRFVAHITQNMMLSHIVPFGNMVLPSSANGFFAMSELSNAPAREGTSPAKGPGMDCDEPRDRDFEKAAPISSRETDSPANDCDVSDASTAGPLTCGGRPHRHAAAADGGTDRCQSGSGRRCDPTSCKKHPTSVSWVRKRCTRHRSSRPVKTV